MSPPFRTWHSGWRAFIEAQRDGVEWDKLLKILESRKQNIVTEKDVADIAKTLRLTQAEMTVVASNLYHMLLAYTKGHIKDRIVIAERKNVFDQYRLIHYEHMNITAEALVNAKGRLWEMKQAKNPRQIGLAIAKWEADRRFLQAHDEYDFTAKD